MKKYLKYKSKYLELKKRLLQEEYNKNKKMIGGGKITEITENNEETEFKQNDAVINYGISPISTYNLVNCIAIGGIFQLHGNHGTFLTHESPTDYPEQQRKLIEIKRILHTKSAVITNIVLFHIDEPSKDVYEGGLTTIHIIRLMFNFCTELFGLRPGTLSYSCDISTMRCGKAVLSSNGINTLLTPFRNPSIPSIPENNGPMGTFVVDVLYNNDNEKIYKCPICKAITGTLAPKYPIDTSLFSHSFNCPNKNKIPVEI